VADHDSLSMKLVRVWLVWAWLVWVDDVTDEGDGD